MDRKTVFVKTQKGEKEIPSLFGDMKRVMLLIDDKSTLDEVTKRAPPSLRGDLPEIVQRLLDAELIRDKDKAVAAPKITAPKMATPKPAAAVSSEELDFTTVFTAPSQAEMAAEAARQKAQQEAEAKARQAAEAAHARAAELEAAVAAAKLKASAEAEAKAEAKARQEAEFAARAKAEAEVKAKREAAERQLAEAKAKQEAEARMRAEQEAARVKAELEAAARAKAEAEARVRAEIEAAARAKQEAEAKAKLEAEAARVKAEQEAARIKAELEAAARAKAEAEAARIKAEQEAARIKAELEAAKARAEAEARALAEERARQEAEAARLKAEQEAARIKAEQEAAARAKADMEERARREAEAARVKAEQAAALLKAEHEAAVRAKAEAEEHARRVAEAARLQAEQDEAARLGAAAAARLEAEEKAQRDAQLAEQEALAAAAKQTAGGGAPFSINLDALSVGAAPAPAESAQLAHVEQAEAERLREKQEVERRAAAEAKAVEEQKAKQHAVAEMARLKAEQEAARLKAEQEARAKEEEQALAAEQASAWAEAEERAKLQAKLDAEQAAQQAALSQAKAVQKNAPRARRGKPLPWVKIAFGLIALALLVVIVLPYVWPMQEYVAPLEQRLSAQLKQPVHIGGMSASSLPPSLKLQNVTLGNAQEVKATAAVLSFDPLSLFSDIKEIGNAELQNVTLDARHLDQVAGWLKGLGGDMQYPVRHMTIQSLQVNAGDAISLPALKGGADLAQGKFTRVVLHSEDEKLNIELQSEQNRWQLSFGVQESALPMLPKVMFGDFSAKGDIGDGEVVFSEIDAHAYGGIWSGRGRVTWSNGWQAQARIQAKTMELEKLFPQLGLSGEVFVEGNFTSQGAKLAQLGDAPRLDGTFMAKNGTINGMDMTETARLSSREHLPGGRTNFDELTGALQLENRNLHFRQVKITSGTLIGNGSFDVSAGNQLSGNFSAEITMRAGSNPLVMFGTVTEPKLRAR